MRLSKVVVSGSLVACTSLAGGQERTQQEVRLGPPFAVIEPLEPVLFPQEELIAGLPYDGISSIGYRAQDYESTFDLYDIFIIEDIAPSTDAALDQFRSAAYGNGSPSELEDMLVRIFENNGSGFPGEDSYTGQLVMTSIPGAGFWDGNDEFGTEFGGQCLPAGSYYIVWAVRLDFLCCGQVGFMGQRGEPGIGGGKADNAYQWNPGEAFGLGTHIPLEDINGDPTGVNYLLFGTPADCSFPCSNPDCPADLDGDGDTDGDDFFAYLDLFATNDPCADIDQDGDADGDDFFAYLDLFVQGC